MKQLKQLDQTKAVRILLLLLLDAVMINLASFLALFVRMELNMTAVRESGFSDQRVPVCAFGYNLYRSSILAVPAIQQSLGVRPARWEPPRCCRLYGGNLPGNMWGWSCCP